MPTSGNRAMLWMVTGLLACLTGCRINSSHEKGGYSGNTAASVTVEVNDYSAWLKAYKEYSDSDARMNVYVSADNPKLVTYYELTRSHAEAKADFSSHDMHRMMRKAGVVGDPWITYFDLKYRTQVKCDKQYRVLVTHDVADYDGWKKIFDAGESRRAQSGIELRGIYIDSENPNLVGVFLATDDPSKLKEQIESEEFKKILAEADVASKPTLTVLKVPAAN